MGVVYVECKVCCEIKCKCFICPRRREMDDEMENAVSPMEDSARRKKSCGCSDGASRFYRYND
ncbi:hypothetical protein FZC76_03870 [Sutcliffiella horikoshii]|uniref:Uncharacterized protein n=1 Tax=Sutcliffiella horikoshii TaxID=79883 RepID=A0A5D4T820_9BACI|nr:hypothetical protein [Sutcliffiella horikoshii]TYS71041.1 hypothetical protein FZC76_03870 [Sutcliffiella horikoshii]